MSFHFVIIDVFHQLSIDYSYCPIAPTLQQATNFQWTNSKWKTKKKLNYSKSYNIIHQAQINYYPFKREVKAKEEKSFLKNTFHNLLTLPCVNIWIWHQFTLATMDMTRMWYIYDTHDYLNNIIHIYDFDGRVKISLKELQTMLHSCQNYKMLTYGFFLNFEVMLIIPSCAKWLIWRLSIHIRNSLISILCFGLNKRFLNLNNSYNTSNQFCKTLR
jgi:hypothetical protein